jgi:hypothetical protein
MEKIARDRLVKDWSTFMTQDKAMCVMKKKYPGHRGTSGGSPALKSTPMRARRTAGTAVLPFVRRAARPGLKGTVVSAESNESKIENGQPQHWLLLESMVSMPAKFGPRRGNQGAAFSGRPFAFGNCDSRQ